MHPVISLFVLLLFSCIAYAQVGCYYAPGQVMNQDYTPCGKPSDGIQIACCHLGDFCLASGACYSPVANLTYVGGCTDPAFEDASCAGQKCQKTSQVQGLGVCNNNWVCCTGVEQQGVEPSRPGPDSCPCDGNLHTFLMGSSQIATTASLSNEYDGQIIFYSSDGSTIVGPESTSTAVVSSTATAEPKSTGFTTPSVPSPSPPPASASAPANSPTGSSSRSTSTLPIQKTFTAAITSSIPPSSSLSTSSGPFSTSNSSGPTPLPSTDTNSETLSLTIGLSLGIPLCLLFSGLLVHYVLWRRGYISRLRSGLDSPPKELQGSVPGYVVHSPVEAPTMERQELSGWQAPELMDRGSKF